MKLKIRIDSDDLLMFGIFAIFLLYIVAVVVANIASFASEGYLAGPNPLPAFTPDLILSTIVFYLVAVGGIIFSVKSYIFEFDKGIGLTTDKKDKGYSRWAKEKEIIKSKKVEAINIKDKYTYAAGTPLLYKKDQVYVDNGENHTLVLGATGSGKTQSVILPSVKILSKNRESMVITDPKGEIYEKTSEMLRKKGYQILLLNFRDPQNGSAWNPMDLPYKMYRQGNQDKAIELLDDLAANILYDEKNKDDPFWEKTSADYFAGLALGLFEDAEEDEININSISVLANSGEDKFGGSTYIKEYFNMKSPDDAAYINASGTVNAPNETKGSILSVFRQKIKLFATRENLSEMLSHSDVDLSTIGKKPTAVFIVIQDEKKTYHSLVTILLKQIYETLISVAQEAGGKLPVRTNFLLDEFANMPPLKDVTTMITAARSRQIRFTMIIQNFAQLDSVYGKEDAETLRGNCGNLIYLVTTELKALEEISKLLGEEKAKKDEKTASKPLATISDLQHMKENDVIIMRLRMNPFKTHFTPDYALDWDEKNSKASYPIRQKQEVHIFDIKSFVKKKKKEQLMEMMNSMDSEEGGNGRNPFLGGLPPIPGMIPNANGTPNREMPPMMERERPFMEQRPSRPNNGEINVDELVKKIDAEIARIEEEEKRIKEEEAKAKDKEDIQEEQKELPVDKDDQDVETNGEKEEIKEAVVEEKKVDLNLDDEDEDDDFFDDFFDN